MISGLFSIDVGKFNAKLFRERYPTSLKFNDWFLKKMAWLINLINKNYNISLFILYKDEVMVIFEGIGKMSKKS